MDTARIEQMIRAGLPDATVTVTGEMAFISRLMSSVPRLPASRLCNVIAWFTRRWESTWGMKYMRWD